MQTRGPPTADRRAGARVGIQHDRAIFNLAASFHAAEPGFEHQRPTSEVPAPETLPTGRRSGRRWPRGSVTGGSDPVVHTRLLTYASDMTLLDTTLMPHGTSSLDESIQLASLDHAMWLRQPFRADDWLLYDQATVAASGARGLARGSVFRRDGVLVASVMQEGIIRRSTR